MNGITIDMVIFGVHSSRLGTHMTPQECRIIQHLTF